MMSKSVGEILSLLNLLPNYEEIKSLLQQEPEAAYILSKSIENIHEIQERKTEFTDTNTEECSYLIQSLTDKFWERIHTGHFSEVPLATRKIYSIANYFKIFYLLFESLDRIQLETCTATLDDAMLVGSTQDLYAQSNELQRTLMKLFDELSDFDDNTELPVIEIMDRSTHECDVPIFDCPTVMNFKKMCFDALQPALLLNTISHWPALVKWRDLNYINKVAGNRCVPIEIGTNYTTDEWSQQIVKIREFLKRQFSTQKKYEEGKSEIEYLAQHELFEQIPTLKEDICIPDYCSLGVQGANSPDIKAWLGPKGTVSPMHFDPKHNLLCQIFGSKSIILASPEDSTNLYPHETEFLSNTSQIDAANLDLKEFPLVTKVRFYKLTLQSGDCLYMPPKWWHYVRAESPSFSVSFWWE